MCFFLILDSNMSSPSAVVGIGLTFTLQDDKMSDQDLQGLVLDSNEEPFWLNNYGISLEFKSSSSLFYYGISMYFKNSKIRIIMNHNHSK